ncbi:MAG: TldD/PmbA family protein [Bacillota bacterium]
MMGRASTLEVVDRALSMSRAEQTQVNLSVQKLELTRFNANYIHQNLSRHQVELTVKAIDGQRAGTASTNLLDDASLRDVVERALAFARLSQPDPDWKSLPAPEPLPEVEAYVPRTGDFTPAERADWCGAIIGRAEKAGVESAGTFSTEVSELAVGNSLGIRAYHCGTQAFIRTIMTAGDHTGYADRLARDVAHIDPEAVAGEALARAVLKPGAVSLEPGEYDTIFEEYAVADLVRFFGYLAFGALAKQEGRSFMARRMGEQVLGENVTIWDDGLDGAGLATPFDLEGVPKQKVVLIDRGVASGVVYDTSTAGREHRKSTGHSSGGYYRGGMPGNMFMATGGTTRQEMVEGTQKGVLVTRFHYTHCPEPMRLVATGTTRDGTFLIRDGQVVARLNNLRFTQSLLDAFGRIEAITPTARLTRDWWSTFCPVLPAIKVNHFAFTGSTTF